MDYIKLKKRNTLKFGIQDEDGNIKLDENGHEVFIEFDLEDLEVPERYSKCVYLIEKAENTFKNKVVVINKKQDVKGKGLMTKNEELKMQALKEYYKNVEEAMDMFLGKGGTQKIFGDRRYFEMFDDLVEMLEPIMPKIQVTATDITSRIKEKYKKKDTGAVIKSE